jgi:hypothetical protein
VTETAHLENKKLNDLGKQERVKSVKAKYRTTMGGFCMA